MKKSLKIVTMIATLLVSTSLLLAGCGKKEETKPSTPSTPGSTAFKPDTSKKVNLKLYMVFAKKDDTDKVVALINQKLSEKINATISVEYLATADKYALAFASGDDFDGIYCADWMLYGQQASKNGYLEITDDLLTKYAPNLKKNIPQANWDQAKINNKIFMIPQMTDEYNQRQIGIRGDLRKKYNVPEVKDIKSLEVYMDAIVKNEKAMIPWSGRVTELGFLSDLWKQSVPSDGLGAAGFGYAYYEDFTKPTNYKIVNSFDLPWFTEAVNGLYSWNQKGYIAKSALTNTTIDQGMNFDNGKSAVFIQNSSSVNGRFTAAKIAHPDWSVELIDTTAGKNVLGYKASSGGIGIHATSKNADRLLMAIDYLRYDKDAQFLAQRGIKGEHWDIAPGQSDENVIVPGPSAAKYGDSFTWGAWRNSQYQTTSPDSSVAPGYNALFKNMKSRTVSHPLQAFSFNNDVVKSEVAALKSVDDQYMYPLIGGYVDPTTGLATYKEKLKAAGFDKVKAELQTQIDVFVKNLK